MRALGATRPIPVSEWESLRLTIYEDPKDGGPILSIDKLYCGRPPPVPPLEKMREVHRDFAIVGSNHLEISTFDRRVTRVRKFTLNYDREWIPQGEPIWIAAGLGCLQPAFAAFTRLIQGTVLAGRCAACKGFGRVPVEGPEGFDSDWAYCKACTPAVRVKQ